MLTILLNWLGDILNINRRSHIICHIMTLQLFDILKNCAFRKNIKRCLINLISWVGLSWGFSHIKKL